MAGLLSCATISSGGFGSQSSSTMIIESVHSRPLPLHRRGFRQKDFPTSAVMFPTAPGWPSTAPQLRPNKVVRSLFKLSRFKFVAWQDGSSPWQVLLAIRIMAPHVPPSFFVGDGTHRRNGHQRRLRHFSKNTIGTPGERKPRALGVIVRHPPSTLHTKRHFQPPAKVSTPARARQKTSSRSPIIVVCLLTQHENVPPRP